MENNFTNIAKVNREEVRVNSSKNLKYPTELEGNNKPLLFDRKSNKNIIKPLKIIGSDTGLARHYTPAAQEWHNSIYSYNSNYIKTLPVADSNLIKLLNNYFNFQINHKHLRTKRIEPRYKRLSANRVFIGKGNVKHTSSKAIITFYVYNAEKRILLQAMSKWRYDLFLEKKTKRVIQGRAVNKEGEETILYNRPLTWREYLADFSHTFWSPRISKIDLPTIIWNFLSKSESETHESLLLEILNISEYKSTKDRAVIHDNLKNKWSKSTPSYNPVVSRILETRDLSSRPLKTKTILELNEKYTILEKYRNSSDNKSIVKTMALSSSACKDILNNYKVEINKFIYAPLHQSYMDYFDSRLNSIERDNLILNSINLKYKILNSSNLDESVKKNLKPNFNESLNILNNLPNNINIFKDYINIVKSSYLGGLTILNKLLRFNDIKFTNLFMSKLTKLVEDLYNKKVEFNIVNLKGIHFNTDIFTQIVSLKLKNRDNKLYKVLKSSLRKVKLPKSFSRTEKYNKISKGLVLVNRVRNNNITSMFNEANVINQGINDPLNNLLFKLYPSSDNLEVLSNSQYFSKLYKITLKSFVLKSLKHLIVRGIRIEAKGRLTKRFTASRSAFKMKWKGGLKNVDSSFRGLSTIMLRGHVKSNIQYSISSSKTRNGAFGVKGWVSNK